MARSSVVVFTLLLMVMAFSFFASPPNSPAKQVKEFYLHQAFTFIKEVDSLQANIYSGNKKKIPSRFFRARAAYKQIEVFVEYYFTFYAVKLNGPPIPFFEEDEPDVPENKPFGMQVIESLIFPELKKENNIELKFQVDELVRLAKELPTITESFEFNDANIFDAFMEETF
ncbi:MAG: hypothetical protein ABIT07_01985, partial [Ferruginibacter sp.]